jgi:hypothetical protein
MFCGAPLKYCGAVSAVIRKCCQPVRPSGGRFVRNGTGMGDQPRAM